MYAKQIDGEFNLMNKNLAGIFLTILLLTVACQNTPTPTAVPVVPDAPLSSASSVTDTSATPCGDGAYPAEGYPAGCAPNSGAQTGYPVPQPLEPMTIPEGEEWFAEVLPPGAGLATVTGIVMSASSGKPVVNVPVALAEVYYQGDSGAFVLDGAFSPHTVSDSEGRFAFVDVPAMDYVLVVGNPEVNDYKIIEEPSGKARVWTAAADQILDMSVITVDLRIWK
ncbi:MAG: carboxypeptidase regulatory-like domain-containing protein [Anaerolineae bacterium]|nr:carboxypeptidase regulatory-like domain-containing protein [Anaerolineae bacterium]